jgi:ABC-type dipeptide/oligopeptide/nickel transport system permease subunit
MYWWMIVFPLIAILGLGLAIGLLCDGIDKWLRLQA